MMLYWEQIVNPMSHPSSTSLNISGMVSHMKVKLIHLYQTYSHTDNILYFASTLVTIRNVNGF